MASEAKFAWCGGDFVVDCDEEDDCPSAESVNEVFVETTAILVIGVVLTSTVEDAAHNTVKDDQDGPADVCEAIDLLNEDAAAKVQEIVRVVHELYERLKKLACMRSRLADRSEVVANGVHVGLKVLMGELLTLMLAMMMVKRGRLRHAFVVLCHPRCNWKERRSLIL